MFGTIKLLGTKPKGIALETKKANPIANEQAPEFADFQLGRLDAKRLREHSNWKLRKPISGIYNCFGHVWASRRTSIYEDPSPLILGDDNYRMVVGSEGPSQGDLALYRSTAATKRIIHVGVISEVRPLNMGGATMTPIPWVLSKWSDASSEVLHHINDVPWKSEEFTLEIWTDRPPT